MLLEAVAQGSLLLNGACTDYSDLNRVSARDTELQSFVQWSLPNIAVLSTTELMLWSQLECTVGYYFREYKLYL
jgi:hypothetical protein